MKKCLPFIAAILLFMLQSCSINTETVLHKNAESTSEINIDFREMMGMMKGMMPDSAKTGNNFAELNKLPKEWTSLYDFEKKERKKVTKDPDSVRLMKKMFLKANSENGELVGFAVRQDHFSAKDYEFVNKGTDKEKMPFTNKIFQSWDGKTLILDTNNFTDEDYKNIGNTSDKDKSTSGEDEMMAGMMKMDLNHILKFETKIKSITGLHDWVQKIDDRTIKISFTSDQLAEAKSALKNKDAKIIILTE